MEQVRISIRSALNEKTQLANEVEDFVEVSYIRLFSSASPSLPIVQVTRRPQGNELNF